MSTPPTHDPADRDEERAAHRADSVPEETEAGADDPKRPLYERLTRAEMRAGLYEHPERIGTLRGWQATLAAAGVRLRGHRLVRE